MDRRFENDALDTTIADEVASLVADEADVAEMRAIREQIAELAPTHLD